MCSHKSALMAETRKPTKHYLTTRAPRPHKGLLLNWYEDDGNTNIAAEVLSADRRAGWVVLRDVNLNQNRNRGTFEVSREEYERRARPSAFMDGNGGLFDGLGGSILDRVTSTAGPFLAVLAVGAVGEWNRRRKNYA